MRVYFLSARPCALQINGVFAGYTNGFPRHLDLSPRDLPFCELIPTDGKFLPLRFVLRDNLASRLPDGLSLCFLPDGIALYADKFFPSDGALRILKREHIAEGTITLYAQAGLHYLWEKEEILRAGEADETLSDCKISACGGCILLQGKNTLCALDGEGMPFFQGKTEKVSFGEETDLHQTETTDTTNNKRAGQGGAPQSRSMYGHGMYGNSMYGNAMDDTAARGGNEEMLRIVAPAGDFRGRTAEYVFACKEGRATLQRRTLSPAAPLPERFALCALLQALRLGEDEEAASLLGGDLAASLPDLKAYLGEYVAVLPLPFSPFGAGTVCRKKDRLYTLKTYAADMREGKIENIRPLL